jgi:hypothetical protein
MSCCVFSRRLRAAAVASLAALVAGFGGEARATQLWYDGFTIGAGQYAAGPLGGQTGGTGSFFTGAWTAQDGGNNHQVVGTSLSRPGQLLPSTGGAVSDDALNAGRTARLFATPWSGRTPPEGTFYIGFLASFGAGPTIHHRVLEMWDQGFDDGTQRNLLLGYSEFAEGIGATMSLVVRNNQPAPAASPTIRQALAENINFLTDNGQTHSLVLRFDLSNTADSDRVRVYLAAPGATEPAMASADINNVNLLFDRMGTIVNFVFGDGGAPTFDELRVGTTFADVSIGGVPEPGSLSLLALGGLGLFGVARRKRS